MPSQQNSSNAYSKNYDRGHLVPANHLDHSKLAITQSNYMTNVLPQAANMNRGAWLHTEEIIECYRDIADIHVIGGVLYQKDSNYWFYQTHGIVTPSYYWKVIIKGNDSIAWIVPNTQAATRNSLDQYIVSVGELEPIIGESLPVNNKQLKPKTSWPLPKGCNKS